MTEFCCYHDHSLAPFTSEQWVVASAELKSLSSTQTHIHTVCFHLIEVWLQNTGKHWWRFFAAVAVVLIRQGKKEKETVQQLVGKGLRQMYDWVKWGDGEGKAKEQQNTRWHCACQYERAWFIDSASATDGAAGKLLLLLLLLRCITNISLNINISTMQQAVSSRLRFKSKC